MEYVFENIYMKRFLYFNIYVIRGIDGDILIDTGFFGTRYFIKRWLKQFNIKLIILTHAHVDHIWNAAYFKRVYNCEVALSEKDINNIDNSKIISIPLNDKFIYWTKLMHFGMKHFIPEKFDIDIKLKDGVTLKKFDNSLEIFDLSGHTSGSIGIKYKDYLFVGDALVNRRKKVSLAYQNQNYDNAKKSLNIIKSINPKIIFVGHDKFINMKNVKLEKIEF